MKTTRRDLARLAPAAAVTLSLPAPLAAIGAATKDDTGTVPASFPSQDPAKVREMVGAAHTRLDRVKELVEAQPALANAAIDWGFGDWESALGAASHMGRRDIAEVLMAHGARPDLFTHAMLGHLEVVKALVEAQPGVQSTLGPHGFTLLDHARHGREPAEPVVAYLEEVGGADPRTQTVPLPHPLEAYMGEFRYGDGADQTFVIEETRGGLGLRRGEGFPRSLFHLGNDEFHPGGAIAVRIRFAFEGGKASVVTVLDPDVIAEGVRS